MMPQEELDEWCINAGFFLLEIEIFDQKYRAEHINHKCAKGWYDSGKGRWFCEHLVEARERNKKLTERKKEHLSNSPFVKHSHSFAKVAKSFYRLD